MVLYPIDKPDYRDLALAPDLRDSILIFTLGDEGTSPFRFNPFEVVEGMLIKTHMSRLMRVFTAAFSLHDPLPMIYREALRQVYRQYGWDIAHDRGRSDGVYPIMSDFYQAINAVTALLKYGREMQDNIRQASVIRIGDLLENVGHVVNVRKSMPLATILRQPTLVELGRIGSSNDTALLMGFILLQFTAELERSNTRSQRSNRPHITVVEEAHRLMSDKQGSSETGSTSQSAASEDFSNILAEVRGYGAGIMIAEQIPTLLVKGAIGNTYTKIMHWLEDPPSFDLFSNVMNLNEAQRLYARSLTPGFAIVRNRYGRPVHISIPPFAQVTDAAGAATDDATIATFMRRQRQQFDITDVSVTSWEGGLEAQSASDPVPAFRQEVDPALAHLCSASDSTLVWKIPLEYIAKQVPHLNAAAKAHDWVQLRELCSQALHDHRIDSSAARIKCYLVRVASLPQGKGPNAGKTFYSLYDHYRQAIQHI